MSRRSRTGGSFCVLDGAAVVLGAAIASVHVRGVIRAGISTEGWVLVWGAFGWIALTAAGPFLFAVRRCLRRVAAYPKVGDLLWGMLGLPWGIAAGVRSLSAGRVVAEQDLYSLTLTVGVGLACLVSLGVVWSSWVTVSAEKAAETAAGPWTNRVGLILAVAWPVQCGASLLVLA